MVSETAEQSWKGIANRQSWAGIAHRAHRRLGSRAGSLIGLVIAIVWSVPTLGLFVTSVRPQADIQDSGWWMFFVHPRLSFENYHTVLFGAQTALWRYVINSIVIVVPAVVIPVALAALCSYALAWVKFPGRDLIFIAIFAIQIVPVQVSLIPLLQMYVHFGIAGSFWPLWLSHSMFAMPLAIVLIHNFMRELPAELIEAARVDGASQVDIFRRVVAPLVAPAIAAFAIFQFLWVWNDLLVGLTFAGGTPDYAPLTVTISTLTGTSGGRWELLAPGAFISMLIPLIVFLGLQRYFVRGLLAGGLKG